MLVPNDPSSRAHGRNPYAGYDTSRVPFLYRGEMPKGIEPMARVVVVKADRVKPLVVSLDHLRKRTPLARGGLRLTWRAGQASALDADRVATGRDVGTVEATRVDATGRAEPVPYDVTFAFVAHAFHPEVAIIED